MDDIRAKQKQEREKLEMENHDLQEQVCTMLVCV